MAASMHAVLPCTFRPAAADPRLRLGCCGSRFHCRAAKQSSYKQTSGGSQKKQQHQRQQAPPPQHKNQLQLQQQQQQAQKRGSASKSVEVVDDGGLPPSLLPKPPAGFVLDSAGEVVLMAPANKRMVTLVDPGTGRPLECVVRRAFQSSDGVQCLLLTPLDMALQILKFQEGEGELGLRDLTDQELEQVLPTASYALAKIRLHLMHTGFCLTARGGFCYTDEDVIDLNTEYGGALGGSLAEGVEITTFFFRQAEYLVYTPFDPLMFVACVDVSTGHLTIADDDLLNDQAVLEAIDEEDAFQAVVEEEEAVNRALKQTQGRA